MSNDNSQILQIAASGKTHITRFKDVYKSKIQFVHPQQQQQQIIIVVLTVVPTILQLLTL